MFARELAALPAARMVCLCEPCLLPTSGTQAVRFEASAARMRRQTWILGPAEVMQVEVVAEDALYLQAHVSVASGC